MKAKTFILNSYIYEFIEFKSCVFLIVTDFLSGKTIKKTSYKGQTLDNVINNKYQHLKPLN